MKHTCVTIPLSPIPLSSVNWKRKAAVRRLGLTLLALLQTAIACYYLTYVLPYHGGNLLEVAILILFGLLFLWISIGFWIAAFGFFLRRRGGDPMSLCARHADSALAATPLAKTAVVMPVYHESVARSLNGLRAIYRSLERTGQLEHFEFYILSDSRDPEIWLQEQVAWFQLCQELGAQGRLFYRRRTINQNYKSGNIADFLRRWGRHYRYLLVLDADSLVAGETVVKMVRLMQREPQVGILQTAPTLINGRSLYARVQQFANKAYGPLFSTGLAGLQLGEAAFWGHNAIIRVSFFMQHCGLRKLDGPGLFNGPILSHDFVEAAYMGRAGGEVWLEPSLASSYEESPPTLNDDLTRDKRWARGNLQHVWLLFNGQRIRMAHRLAFLNGIMSYLSSPLWLGFLALTTIEATRLVLWPINYFPEAHSLFPLWPEWDPQWAAALAGSTLVLLFVPKFMAIVDILLTERRCDFGSGSRLTFSVISEIVISALLAPIRMLAHSRYVFESLLNLRLSWAGQNRTEETRWRDAVIHHLPGTLLAVAWASFAYWLDPLFFYWSLPVAVPLLLAAPTSLWLGRVGSGQRVAAYGLFCATEAEGVSLLEDLHSGPVGSEGHSLSAVQCAVIDPVYCRIHQHLARSHSGEPQRRQLEASRVRLLEAGPDALSRDELSRLMADRDSLRSLHDSVWRSTPDSCWGHALRCFSGTQRSAYVAFFDTRQAGSEGHNENDPGTGAAHQSSGGRVATASCDTELPALK